MKVNCGETRKEKSERQGKWHKHFAWLPTRVGVRDYRWLEIIERRITTSKQRGWCSERHFEYAPLGTHLFRNIT